MKTDDIRKMGLAYVQVLEAGKKAMDPVNPAELKGTHAQRKDKDIDNDGKVDSSDEYLHKRRQAISKSMKKEEVELDEGVQNLSHARLKFHATKGVPHGSYSNKEIKDEHNRRMRTEPDYVKVKASMNEEVEQVNTNWPVFARIMEKRAEHVKGATPPEPIDSKASQGEKDFVNMHGGLTGNDSGIDGAKAAADTIKAAASQVKTAPKRPADQTVGDKTMPKPKM